MITQQELTDKLTPEIIKKMIDLAEGFSNCDFSYKFGEGIYSEYNEDTNLFFPLLIHRACEGWKNKETDYNQIKVKARRVLYWSKKYDFINYQPTTLTRAECALLHCLIEVLR